MSLGSTATMRDFGSAFQSVEVKPVLNFPYAGSRGRYLVTVKRRPQDFVPTEGACSVAARMFCWLRASAASAMLERVALGRAQAERAHVEPEAGHRTAAGEDEEQEPLLAAGLLELRVLVPQALELAGIDYDCIVPICHGSPP